MSLAAAGPAVPGAPANNDPLQPDLTEPLGVDWRDGPARRGPGERQHGQSVCDAARDSALRVSAAGRLSDAGASADRRRAGISVWRPRCSRRFPQLPVVGSGYSYLQEYLFHAGAANVLRWPDHVCRRRPGGACRCRTSPGSSQEHGKLDRKRICRTFSYCTALMRAKHNEQGQFATGCPPFDKEVYGPIWRRLARNMTR